MSNIRGTCQTAIVIRFTKGREPIAAIDYYQLEDKRSPFIIVGGHEDQITVIGVWRPTFRRASGEFYQRDKNLAPFTYTEGIESESRELFK